MTSVSARLYQPGPRLTWSWYDFAGADAADFLQRLATANILALANGQGVPCTFLNPQGKIRAYFHLWRKSSETFGFELAGGQNSHWTRALTEMIDFYTFGEKIKLTPRTDLSCLWVFPEGAIEGTEAVQVYNHGSETYGRVWWTVWGLPKDLDSWQSTHIRAAESVSDKDLAEWRVLNLSPAIDAEISEDVSPLEIGLRSAVADNKGCYPGQEVIEKIISLGSPPRRLVQLQLVAGQVAVAGDPVRDAAGVEVGKITSIAPPLALAIVRRTLAKENTETSIGNQEPFQKARVTKVAPY